MRFGRIWLLHTKEHHKSREPKFIFCIYNMKILICMKMRVLIIWLQDLRRLLTVFFPYVTPLTTIKRWKGYSSTSSILGSQSYHRKGLNDKEEMDFMGLIQNVKTLEMERQVREDKALPNIKIIAFKCSSSNNNEELGHEDDDDKEPSLLVKNIRRMFHKRECSEMSNKSISSKKLYKKKGWK